MSGRLSLSAKAALVVAVVGLTGLAVTAVHGGSSSPEAGPGSAPATVTWDPLARPRLEADTLLLADLTSPATITGQGGFLFGDGNQASSDVVGNFEFGPGRFGPAVRGMPGRYNMVQYPSDGLVPTDEFTLELWARSDSPWSAATTGAPIVAIAEGHDRDNLEITPADGKLRVTVSSQEDLPGGMYKTWEMPADALGLTAGAWHEVAVTLRQGVLTVFVDGKRAGALPGVAFLNTWSDNGHAGLFLGGTPGGTSGFWVSDLRLSRTARVPGQTVPLRTLDGSLAVDAGSSAGPLPPDFLGALHPGGTPAQTEAALDTIRTDKLLTVTPMKRGAPDPSMPSAGHSGRFSYDWEVVDRTMDWFRTHGVVPYISVDSTPSLLGGSVPPFSGQQLATALSAVSAFGPEPPDNLDDWAAAVADLVFHIEDELRVVVPRWGVWNEPDVNFWNAGMDRYLDLYVATAKAIRSVDPKAEVGGPAVAQFQAPWIDALFRRAKATGTALDFVEYHDYSGDLASFEQAREQVDSMAKAAGYATPFPIVVGEFNWTDANAFRTGTARFAPGHWHVRALGAAYTTAALTDMLALGGIETVVYAHLAYGNPRDGGAAALQLIGPNGEQWAPYNALAGWKQTMVGQRAVTRADLPPGVFAAASTQADGRRVGVVLANYGFAQRATRTVTVVLNLRPGTWSLQEALVDPTHSSRWDVAEDGPAGQAQNDLQTVKRETIHVEAGQPARVVLDLPMWSSTFLTVTA